MKQVQLLCIAIFLLLGFHSAAQAQKPNPLEALKEAELTRLILTAQCVLFSAQAANYHSKADEYPHKDKFSKSERQELLTLASIFEEQKNLMNELLTAAILDFSEESRDEIRAELFDAYLEATFTQEERFLEDWIRNEKPLSVATDRYKIKALACSEAVSSAFAASSE